MVGARRTRGGPRLVPEGTSMSRLFGTDGVRGVANAELTPELAFRLGEAAGHFLGDHGRGTIVVGRDTRKSGEMLEAALVAGLLRRRRRRAAVRASCRLRRSRCSCANSSADGGVVISASHNAPEYNGIKLFSRDGFKLPDELEDEIEAFCTEASATVGAPDRRRRRPASCAIDDALERYIAHCVADDRRGPHRPDDRGRLRARRRRQSPRQRRFAGSARTSSRSTASPTAWTSTSAAARRTSRRSPSSCATTRVDLGIAHDGDADRVLAVDETGAEVDGDAIMAICAAHRHEPGMLPLDTVVSTVMCNLGFEIAMREHGINVIKTKVGDRYVLEQMQTSGATSRRRAVRPHHLPRPQHHRRRPRDRAAARGRHAARPASRSRELRQVMRRYPQVLVNVPVADKARLATSAAHRRRRSTTPSRSWATPAACSCARPAPSRSCASWPRQPTRQSAASVVERLVEVVRAELS